MYKKKKISFVIPVYNEQKLILDTLRGIPKYVDRVYVVDDCSTDNTASKVEFYSKKKDNRVRLISHQENQGPGQAIITGYLKSASDGYDIAVVCGGDNQMPLEQSNRLIDPLVRGEADYCKGNRFMHSNLENMPITRIFGNSCLSFMTKIASGYWHIFDTQDGFTAISKNAIESIDWTKFWKGYGYPSDFLIQFNIYSLRVKEVPRRAIYLQGERQSQINTPKYMLKVGPMIVSGFFNRLYQKYVLRDFHPLIFFYLFGLTLLPLGLLVGAYILFYRMFFGSFTVATVILCALLILLGAQSLFFAFLFDREASIGR